MIIIIVIINNNNNNLFSVVMYNQNQHKIIKTQLLHMNKYIKPSYLGTDKYRVQTKKFH